MGNQQETSSTQAFFSQFSISAIMYNVSLAIYSVMVIVKNMKDAETDRIEPLLHTNAIAWGLGTAIVGLVLTLR